MTMNQFLAKWDKKPINYDGAYGQQCVDVYDQYCVDVVGCRVILIPGAKDIWNNYPTEAFTRIANTPSGVPKKGDVMIWGTGVGQYGHVGIVISADVNSFTTFDQNWPFDNGTGVAHYQWHNYNSVLGWLTPKKDVNFDQVAYDAEQARIVAENARIAEANRVAAEKAKAEADAKAKADSLAAAAEAKRIADEQVKLDAGLKAKKEAEAEAERKIQEELAKEKAKVEETKKPQPIMSKTLLQVIWDFIVLIINKLKGDKNE